MKLKLVRTPRPFGWTEGVIFTLVPVITAIFVGITTEYLNPWATLICLEILAGVYTVTTRYTLEWRGMMKWRHFFLLIALVVLIGAALLLLALKYQELPDSWRIPWG